MKIKRGNVCECQNGKLGIVTSVMTVGGEVFFEGIKLDGTRWQSKNLKLVADNVVGFIRDCKMDSDLMERAINA